MRVRFALLRKFMRFRRNEKGAAAVEFALILPFLLVLFMGSIEASSLITVDRRVTIISGTVGDLVARTDGTLTSSQLTDFFKASQGIIFPYSTTGLKQVVSLISVTSAGVAKVKWSCAYNGGTKRTVNASYTLPSKMNELARTNGWIVASEVYYSYKPVLGYVFKNALALNNYSFYLPRYEEEIGEPTGC